MSDKIAIYERQFNLFFNLIVDLKCLMCDRGYWLSSLQTMTDSFHVRHKGYKHRAGSDSLITSETYFQYLEMHYKSFFCFLNVNYIHPISTMPCLHLTDLAYIRGWSTWQVIRSAWRQMIMFKGPLCCVIFIFNQL